MALKSNTEIGSPKYITLSGFVLVSDVTLLAKSLETFLHISAPKPVKTPPSENPIALSIVPPMDAPPAVPPAIILSLNMFFLCVSRCSSVDLFN